MEQKYRTEPEGDILRIYAVRDLASVRAGDRGGLIKAGRNLSHRGDAWVSGNAQVSGNAHVSGNARVSGDAQVSGNALVSAHLSTARRSDGYEFALLPMKDRSLMVSAGCRLFSFSDARSHWQATRSGTQLGDETFAILDHLERMAKIRGMA